MSTTLELVAGPEISAATSKLRILKPSYSRLKHIRKSKENHFKPKYCKELKNKLKKYKLRHDGQEDQEVLDVSRILVSSLKIKSPNNQQDKKKLTDELFEELKPKNYLFKMGRRKQVLSKNMSNVIISKISESNISSSGQVERIQDESVALKDKMEVINATPLNHVDNQSIIISTDRRQTNAFKLMMDSRNKSIGNNSPGKEKVEDESDIKEANEKRNLKAKRTLVLQKMAEVKGLLKKKETEEYQEKLIKKKMDRRAERLKKLINNHDKKSNEAEGSNAPTIEAVVLQCPNKNNRNDDNLVLSDKKIKLVNLFQESDKKLKNNTINRKCISKEDQEFLQKLSPSLKKKENMLSYFKKIEKDDVTENSSINLDKNEDSVVIKVKLTPKAKKKKKKKLSLNKDPTNVPMQQNDNVETDSIELVNDLESEKSEKDKRNKVTKEIKTKCEEDQVKHCDNLTSNDMLKVDLTRPRRNVKRPAKYIDEVQLSSSDEELHIFTPKKKKQLDNKDDCYKINLNNDVETAVCNKPARQTVVITKQSKIVKSSMKIMSNSNNQKKSTKLAPIFNVKPILDAAAIEAKQKFLSSGVPDSLKKIKENSNNKIIGSSSFHTVVHIQQRESESFQSREIVFNLREYHNDSECNVTKLRREKDFFEKLLCVKNLSHKVRNVDHLSAKNKTDVLLQDMKRINPNFPVYRTYRMLKDKSRGQLKDCNFLNLDNSVEIVNGVIDVDNESPDTINWTDKYKPMASKQIIGNFDTIKELKKWLISWTENDVKANRYKVESDSSDFYHSDTDSKDSIKSSNNLLVLTGPVGSGKTSMVYAVAAELAIKVLEVNASSKRTGKIMLQDLQEATQSHKVNRGKGSSQESSQKLQEIIDVEVLKKSKKRGRPKKEIQAELLNNCEVLSQSQASQDTQTCMSLILIDDADIVFEQDDGFCSAVVQLVQCSKRPVILIASSATCPHLQRFINSGKVMHTRPFLSNMLGVWLDLMCLAENNVCWPGLGARFLDYYNGDIRKTINCLQFYLTKETSTESETASQNSDNYKMNMEDENSNMCWSDSEGISELGIVSKNFNNVNVIWQYYMKDQIDLLHYQYPIGLFNIWWNIPELLNISLEVKKEQSNKVTGMSSDLEAISNVLEMFSVLDYFTQYHIDNNITDEPWLCIESPSVSEQGNLENYNKCNEVMDEISYRLITGAVVDVQNKLGLENKTVLCFPDTTIKRNRDRIVSRHNNLTKYLNPSAVLDRRALALDYWSTSRTICRIEKMKTDSNTKRNNRFCHYLKSVNVLCNNNSFDNLGSSLSISEDS